MGSFRSMLVLWRFPAGPGLSIVAPAPAEASQRRIWAPREAVLAQALQFFLLLLGQQGGFFSCLEMPRIITMNGVPEA